MISCGSRIISNVVMCSIGAEVSTGVAVFLTSPWPSFRSNLRRFGLGLSRFCSVSCSFVVVGASIVFVGCSGCIGCATGWEGCGSSSHSVVANSDNYRFVDRGGGVGLLGGGAGRPRGGNNIVRYCCIIGLSLLPAWYACRPSLSVGLVITPQSTTCPLNVSMIMLAFCFGIPYVLTCTQPTSSRNLAISRKNGFGMSFVLYALADTEYSPKYSSRVSVGGMSKCFSPIADRSNFFRMVAFVIVSTLSFLAMSRASGCNGASATLMYPSKPFSRSHLRNATKMGTTPWVEEACGE